MSGNFVPEHTATSIGKLDKQVVTFVSEVGATIGVTDNADLVEPDNDDDNGYNLVGTYQTKDIDGYLINADGSAFVKANAQSSVPFRGYLTTATSGGARKIFIGGGVESVEEPEEDVATGELVVYGVKGGICIESTLEHATTLVIYRTSGQIVARVKVLPMTTEVVPMPSQGVYIVNNKKIMVR